jgi:hypothetical protein
MSGVFRNIDPPPPHRLASEQVCPPPAFGAGGGHTRWVERGWGVNSLEEDARHCSVLYICKYFVGTSMCASNLNYASLDIILKGPPRKIRNDCVRCVLG